MRTSRKGVAIVRHMLPEVHFASLCWACRKRRLSPNPNGFEELRKADWRHLVFCEPCTAMAALAGEKPKATSGLTERQRHFVLSPTSADARVGGDD